MSGLAFPQKALGYYGVQNHGLLYTPASSARLFSGGNQAVVATALAAGLPTTYTGGLVLYNPLASTANLSIVRAKVSFIAPQTNVALIGLGVAQSGTALAGTLTAVASVSNNVGSAATAQGKLYSSASITLPVAPYLVRTFGSVDTLTPATGLGSAPGDLDVAGGIILTPGAYCVFTSSAAGTASSFFGSFVWEEVASGGQ